MTVRLALLALGLLLVLAGCPAKVWALPCWSAVQGECEEDEVAPGGLGTLSDYRMLGLGEVPTGAVSASAHSQTWIRSRKR